jgi:hypothetical protein
MDKLKFLIPQELELQPLGRPARCQYILKQFKARLGSLSGSQYRQTLQETIALLVKAGKCEQKWRVIHCVRWAKVKCVSTLCNRWDGAFVIVLKVSPSSINTRSLVAYESGQLTATVIREAAWQIEMFRPVESSVAPLKFSETARLFLKGHY